MRIAYVAKFDLLWNEEGIARLLEEQGHTVFRFNESEFGPDEKSVADVIAVKPDVMLCAKLRIRDPHSFLRELSRAKIPTVSWTFDLYYGYPPRKAQIPFYTFMRCDLVITTDGGHNREFVNSGVSHRTLRQGIYPWDAGYTPKEEDIDVLFVGSPNTNQPHRMGVLEELEKRYEKFVWIGKEDTNEARGKKLSEYVARSKVVIGDSYPSPLYWSNRIYEMTGRGAFLIHPFNEGIDKEFPPDDTVVYYEHGDVAGLCERIDYFLDDPDERMRVRMNAREHCVTHHNMRDRVKELCRLIQENIGMIA